MVKNKMMKQEPIPPSIDVSKMAVPPKRMIPVLTKIGAGRLVGDGFVAVLLHGLCMLIAFWCMDISKHDNPLHSTIEVDFEAPEILPIPEKFQELPDVYQNEPIFSGVEPPVPLGALPQMDAITPLPVIKHQTPIKVKKLLQSRSSEHLEQSEVVHSTSSQAIQSLNKTDHSTQYENKVMSATQRCSGLPKNYPIPMAARKRHEEGVVQVGYQLLPDGQLQHVEIIESSGFFDLDKTAVKAVQSVKCQAALGQPVIKASVPVNFSLNKKN